MELSADTMRCTSDSVTMAAMTRATKPSVAALRMLAPTTSDRADT